MVVAEVVRDRVVRVNTRKARLRVLDDDTVLDVQTADFYEIARGRVVRRDELGDDGDLAVGVDSETRSEESLVAHTEGVEVAAVLVAYTVIALVAVTTVGTRTTGLAVDAADVRSDRCGHRVRFPNVHLVAAGAVTARTSINIVVGRRPVKGVGLGVLH